MARPPLRSRALLAPSRPSVLFRSVWKKGQRPMFQDLNGLAIWMAYSAFFTRLGGEAISDYYAKLFARAG